MTAQAIAKPRELDRASLEHQVKDMYSKVALNPAGDEKMPDELKKRLDDIMGNF